MTWNITAQMLYYDYEVLFEIPDLLQPTEIDVATIVKTGQMGCGTITGLGYQMMIMI